jgi:hypothetical protein
VSWFCRYTPLVAVVPIGAALASTTPRQCRPPGALPGEAAALGPVTGRRWAPSAVILRKSAGTSAMDVAVRGEDRSIPIVLDLLTSIPPALHVLFLNGKEVQHSCRAAAQLIRALFVL